MLPWGRALLSIRTSFSAIALLLAIAAVGCAPRGPRLPPLEPGPDGGRELAEILADQACPSTMVSDFEMTLWTPEYRGLRMVGALRAAWPDRLRIQVRVGAFWPVASIAVSADSAFVSLPRLKGYWAGSPGEREKGNPAALASSLLLLFCPSQLAGSIEDPELRNTSDGLLLHGGISGSDPSLRLELRLPDDRAEIESAIFRDDQGVTLLEASRKGQKMLGEARIPESVRLELPAEEVRLDFRLLRPRSDTAPPADIFRIARPPGTRWIAEEELLSTIGAAATPR